MGWMPVIGLYGDTMSIERSGICHGYCGPQYEFCGRVAEIKHNSKSAETCMIYNAISIYVIHRNESLKN